MDTEGRYWIKVDQTGDGCWPWTAGCFRDGYGKFWDGTYLPSGNSRQVRAHRWGYAHLVGPIPPGNLVCHSCDSPPCQNPSHWFLGTPADNNHDMMVKGRSNLVGPTQPATGDLHGSRLHPESLVRGDRHWTRSRPETIVASAGDDHWTRRHPEVVPRGERHWHSSLTDRQVEEIRARYASGITQLVLAREYGVSQPLISKVVNRLTR